MKSHYRRRALLCRRMPGERMVIRWAHTGATGMQPTLSQTERVRRSDMSPPWAYGLTPTHPAPRSTM
ncbi:hypothetical protein [Acetobacter fallax]|uniref:Uncharacterized protein n=1 Tax=Acetobacter fallax TaxID=1737473 RepID=A0ABX0KFB3_9PROT|nr:hypothetical protein [Acetobacter fallax]NHO33813.1 hypothetical protein [Acetobacter fallax]NHO37374.1 hypothetical protein [Acetobacter fallax]